MLHDQKELLSFTWLQESWVCPVPYQTPPGIVTSVPVPQTIDQTQGNLGLSIITPRYRFVDYRIVRAISVGIIIVVTKVLPPKADRMGREPRVISETHCTMSQGRNLA